MANKKNRSLGEKALNFTGIHFKKGISGIFDKACQDQIQDKMTDLFNNAFESKKYEKAIAIAEIIIEEFDDDELVRVAKWNKARSLFLHALQLRNEDYSWLDHKNENAKKIITESYNQFSKYGDEYGWNDDVLYQQMLIGSLVENFLWGRSRAIMLLQSDNPNYRSDAFDIYNEATDGLFHLIEQYADDGKFTKFQLYEKRKYIYIGRDISQIAGTYRLHDKDRVVNWIFTLDKIPSDLVFPLGRPQPDLYMAHPVKTEQYFLMKNAEETLFMEKVREFCWLVQCLGAREVSFHSIKGMSVSEGYGSSMDTEVDAGVKGANLGGGYGKSSQYDESRNPHQQCERVQHFNPKKKAYCPDDLVWLDSDPAWKDLIKQRLNGNMLDYTYKISSSETCQMSSREKEEVKANIEYMIAKLSGSFNKEKNTMFSSSEETEWSIHVEFAPLDELTGKNVSTKTNSQIATADAQGKAQNATAESVAMSGKILDKAESSDNCGHVQTETVKTGSAIRPKSKSQHSKEKKPSISDNEQEYFNEVKETIEDYDEIGPKERKRLEKTRIRLGISESRAAEIEASVSQSQLTDEEKEYLNEVQEVREDYGEIGPKERKYLEKTRIRLGISVERANELERM